MAPLEASKADVEGEGCPVGTSGMALLYISPLLYIEIDNYETMRKISWHIYYILIYFACLSVVEIGLLLTLFWAQPHKSTLNQDVVMYLRMLLKIDVRPTPAPMWIGPRAFVCPRGTMHPPYWTSTHPLCLGVHPQSNTYYTPRLGFLIVRDSGIIECTTFRVLEFRGWSGGSPPLVPPFVDEYYTVANEGAWP